MLAQIWICFLFPTGSAQGWAGKGRFGPCGQPGIPQPPALLTEPCLSHSALGGVRESPGNAFLVKKEEKPGSKVLVPTLWAVSLSPPISPLISLLQVQLSFRSDQNLQHQLPAAASAPSAKSGGGEEQKEEQKEPWRAGVKMGMRTGGAVLPGMSPWEMLLWFLKSSVMMDKTHGWGLSSAARVAEG